MADEQEQFGVKFQATAESVTEAKESFQHLTEEMKETTKAGETVATATKTVDDAAGELRKQIADLEEVLRKQATALANNELPLDVFLTGNKAARTVIGQLESALDSIVPKIEEVTGQGEGEGGSGGFKGIAGAAVKAEKAIGMLASGGGLGRLPSMLEGVAGALGLGGGVGMAAGGLILAFESIIPKIETFIEKMTGAGESAKHAAEMMKAAYAQMQKLKEQPDEEEQTSAKVIKEALSGKKGMQIATGIEQSLEAEGYSLNEYQKKSLASPGTSQYEKDIILEGQRSAIITRRARMMKELEAGHQATISDVEGMAIRHEGFFPFGTEQHLRQALPENIAAAKKQARDAEEGSRQADAQYARQEAASKENLAVQDQFDKALKDRRAHQDKQLESTMRSDEAFNKKLEHDRVQNDHDAKAAATKADHDAKAAKTKADKFDHEHTPEALTRAEAKAQASEIMGAEREQNQYRANMGAVPFDPGELEQIKHKVMQNMPEARARGLNLGQLVSWAMAQQANEIERGIYDGMGHHGRSQQNTNPRGGH